MNFLKLDQHLIRPNNRLYKRGTMKKMYAYINKRRMSVRVSWRWLELSVPNKCLQIRMGIDEDKYNEIDTQIFFSE